MVAKRALVVDDSRSARAFLARLLEEQQLEVDSAETAEQAIDYLSHNRPDVIFMDHLMPGMDGFQAVQAIKSNPRTAMIPVLMYTSQEGELYLGQARALGAVGVLPKSVGPTDVRAVLQQLHLIAQPQLTTAAEQEVLDAAVAAAASVHTVSVPVLAGPPVDELLRDEMAELRRHLTVTLASHNHGVVSEVRNMIVEALAARPEIAPPVEPAVPRQSRLPWLLALAASVAAAVLGTLLWQGQQQLAMRESELADSRATAGTLAARLAAIPPPAADAGAGTPSDPALLVVRVPFGEAPLAGSRVDALREFVARIAALQQKGTVEVRSHAGRFCLSATAPQGYALANGTTPYIRCDLVADATDPALGNTAQESATFANALAELRKQYAPMLTIDVAAARAEAAGAAMYPEIGGSPPRVPTAAEWNAAAESNNRVEMRWHPAT